MGGSVPAINARGREGGGGGRNIEVSRYCKTIVKLEAIADGTY